MYYLLWNIQNDMLWIMYTLCPSCQVSRIFLKIFVMNTPSQGAATTIRTATICDEEFKQFGGGYFADCNLSNEKIRNDLLEQNTNKHGKSPQLLLWEMTCNVLKRNCKTQIMQSPYNVDSSKQS
eukprot:990029_1